MKWLAKGVYFVISTFILTLSFAFSYDYEKNSSLFIVISEYIDLILLWALTIVVFFSLQGSDPGYVSQCSTSFGINNSIEELEDIDDLKSCSSKWSRFISAWSYSRCSKRDFVHFCRFCKIQTPNRSYHCKDCDRCVSSLDHHCHVIQTCIGEKNHPRFIFFLLLVAISLSRVLIRIYYSQFDFAHSIFCNSRYEDRLYLCSVLYFTKYFFVFFLCFVILLVGILLFMQLFLIFWNVLTIEAMKSSRLPGLHDFDPWESPYSAGFLLDNLRFWLCRDEIILRGYHYLCCSGEKFQWSPIAWGNPKLIKFDELSVSQNCCRNKYYSCC